MRGRKSSAKEPSRGEPSQRRVAKLGPQGYRLTPGSHGSTEFTISEVFWGLLLPSIARSLPDFGLMFERTATDLRTAATRVT